MPATKRYLGDWANILPCLSGPGLSFATCQYIPGDSGLYAVKCGKPTRSRSPYCERHHARCYRGLSAAEAMAAEEGTTLLRATGAISPGRPQGGGSAPATGAGEHGAAEASPVNRMTLANDQDRRR